MQKIEGLIEYLKRNDINIQKISKETGIPADRIYSWRAGRGQPKAEDTQKLAKWFSRPGISADEFEKIQREEKTDKPSDATLEALLKLASANEKLADANQRQTRMLESSFIIATAPQQSSEVFDTMFRSLREFVLDVAAGTSYRSRQEAAAALMSKINPADIERATARDTQKG